MSMLQKSGKLLRSIMVFLFILVKACLEEWLTKEVCLTEMESFFDERPVDELLFAISSFGER